MSILYYVDFFKICLAFSQLKALKREFVSISFRNSRIG